MNELSGMSDAEMRGVFYKMAQRGQFITYVGSSMLLAGGTGTIVAGSGLLFRGRELAVLGSRYVGECALGCPACPHTVVGTIVNGAFDVTANGMPVALHNSLGVHTASCGPNTGTVMEGDFSMAVPPELAGV